MTSRFRKFLTDRSEEFCNEIVVEMVRIRHLSEKEAVERVERHWAGQEILGPEDLVYHEEPEYWAMTIYYGKDSFWWLEGVELKPLPLP